MAAFCSSCWLLHCGVSACGKVLELTIVGRRTGRQIIVKFALPGALSGFTSAPALWFASALLVRQPDGFSQMAIFSASFSLMAAVLLLPSIANNVGMSLINHHKGTGNSLEYRQIFSGQSCGHNSQSWWLGPWRRLYCGSGATPSFWQEF